MFTRHTRYYALGQYQKRDAVDIMSDWNSNFAKIDTELKSLDGVTSGVKTDMETTQAEIGVMLNENVEMKNSVTLSQGKLLAITPALNVLMQVAAGAEEKATKAVTDIDAARLNVTEAENAVTIANDANNKNALAITALQDRITVLENA